MTTQNTKRRLARASLGALTLFVVLLGAAAPAQAGILFAAGPDFPSTVTVGSSGSATMSIINNSNGAENAAPVTLTDIQMVPSCGTTFGAPPDNDCPLAFADPGVFAISATGTGQVGTACAGQTFSITQNNPATGQVTFTPTVPATPVVLAPAGTANGLDRCVIGFTYTVLKLPAVDSQPGAAGLQTTALGFAAGQNTIGGVTNSGTGTGADTVTVTAVATMTTVAVRNANGTISDTATIAAPAGGPLPTGTVTFTIFGPDDPTCAGAPRFTSINPVTGGTTSTSTPFLPGPGTAVRARIASSRSTAVTGSTRR